MKLADDGYERDARTSGGIHVVTIQKNQCLESTPGID